MPYVQRQNGIVVGIYPVRQEGYAEEFLADNHPDVLGFPTPTPEQVRAATIRADASRQDMLTRLQNATLAQIDSYVDNQINGTTVTQVRDQTRLMFKRVLRVIALDSRL